MAEALATVAVVSSIAQLVDFGSKVISRLNEFQSGLNPKTYQQIKAEIPLMLDVLNKTKQAIDAGRVKQETARVLLPVIDGCREQVESLNAILVKILQAKGDSRARRVLKAVSSSLSQDDKVDRISSSIQKHVQSLTLYYAAASSTLNPRTDGTLIQIRRWLSAPDPSVNYQRALKQHLQDTGLWFLESEPYAKWKTTAASFMWLHGIPGCGKTIMSSTIIQDIFRDCRDDPTKVIGYYYFAFNDSQKQRADLMVRSLIAQLSRQCFQMPTVLKSLFTSCENEEQQPLLDALLEVLHQMIQDLGASFIVLDALDECNDRAELLEILQTMAGWQIENLHFIVISRDEADIRNEVEGLVCEHSTVCLQRKLVDKDICSYVLHRLSNDKNLQRWRKHPEVQQEIKTVLTEKACGMWRLASCHLNMLGKCLNRSMVQNSLQNLPRTLEETYDRILCAIDENYHSYASCILQWLAFSARPLQVEEVAEIVAITSDKSDSTPMFDKDQVLTDPSDILRICSSLVTIVTRASDDESDDFDDESDEKVFSLDENTNSETSQQYLTLAHYSVKEYLISPNIQKGPAAAFSIQERVANKFIAERCLVYLLRFEEPDCFSENALHTYKLAKYTAQFWIQHAQAAEPNTKLMYQLVRKLFALTDSAYVNWLRIWNPDHPWKGSDLTRELNDLPAPLYLASLSGLTEIVRLLINDTYVDINAQGGRYSNALKAASSEGHVKVVELLLEAGADVDARTRPWGTALRAASIHGHEKVVEQLLKAGADVNAQIGQWGTALQAASIYGHEKVVEQLLKAGADVNARIRPCGTALKAASSEGHVKVVELLLEAGADVNARNRPWGTALRAASVHGRKMVVERLLKAGANLKTGDS